MDVEKTTADEPIVDEKSEDWKSKLRGEPVKVRKTRFNQRQHRSFTFPRSICLLGRRRRSKDQVDIALPSNESADDQTKLDDVAVAKSPNIAFDDSSDTIQVPVLVVTACNFLTKKYNKDTFHWFTSK